MVATEADNIQEDLLSRLDSAVTEIFEMMLDHNCAPVDTDVDINERITACIRFSGALNGECLVYTSQAVAFSLSVSKT
jgi:chemotaxis protein CheX